MFPMLRNFLLIQYYSKPSAIYQSSLKVNNKGKFAILGFNAKKGEKVVSKGAVSVSELGSPNKVAKWKVSAGNKGKEFVSNGHIDTKEMAALENLSMVPSVKNGKLDLNCKLGDYLTAQATGNPNTIAELIQNGSFAEVQKKLYNFITLLGNKI